MAGGGGRSRGSVDYLGTHAAQTGAVQLAGRLEVETVIDEIEPVMTAEEWERAREIVTDVTCVMENGSEEVMTNHEPQQVMAIANDRLPDGHPLKITRLDVVRLREASGGLEDAGAPQLGAALAGLAAKLAALLPPEGA